MIERARPALNRARTPTDPPTAAPKVATLRFLSGVAEAEAGPDVLVDVPVVADEVDGGVDDNGAFPEDPDWVDKVVSEEVGGTGTGVGPRLSRSGWVPHIRLCV